MAYAGVFERREEYHRAIEIILKALEIDERMNDPYSIALSKANLGIFYMRTGQVAQAFEHLRDALNYYVRNNFVYEAAMVRVSLGESLFAQDRKQDGIREICESEKLFEQLDNKRELSNVYQLLSQFFAQVDDYKTALEYQRKYTECLKYFFDVEKTNALARAEKEFEAEQKKKEATLLQEKNDEIKKYVHKLEISNNELNQFAHVASHDMKEPLRVISAYMGLLKKSLHGQLNEQQTEFFGFVQDGAKRMERLIVDLLHLAKVDANPRIETVKLQNIVDEIKLNLDTLMKEKNASIIASDLPDILADRTPGAAIVPEYCWQWYEV